MSSALSSLVKLQEIDSLIRDAEEHGKKETSLGFTMENRSALEAARDRVRAEIPRRWLNLYERLQNRFGRAVVPVEDRICLGCFMTLPTSALPADLEEDDPSLCEHCGRILYW